MDIERVYVKANMSNGLCGCDEEYVMAIDIPFTISRYDRSLYIWSALYDHYTYAEGFCGIENFEEEAEELGYDSLDEWHEERINESSIWTEITKEEFDEIVEEEEIEVR